MSHTKRYNINRGYMKLEVSTDGIDLLKLVSRIIASSEKVDLKLSSQILNAGQSVSANIAEGYCRKSINEYLYFLNVALGSLGELMTRMIGLSMITKIADETFSSFDETHYKVENKLLALIKTLQAKRREGTWEDEFREPFVPYRT